MPHVGKRQKNRSVSNMQKRDTMHDKKKREKKTGHAATQKKTKRKRRKRGEADDKSAKGREWNAIP